MADFAIRINGAPIRVQLGENTADAAKQALRSENAAVQAELAQANAEAIIDKVSKTFTPVDVLKTAREPNGAYSTAVNVSQAFAAVAPASGTYVDIGSIFVGNLSAAYNFRVRFWTRPLADGDVSGIAQGPGFGPNDVLVFDKNLTRDDMIGDIDWSSTAQQEVKIDLDYGLVDGDTILIFGLSATNEAAAWVPITPGFRTGIAAEPDWPKGFMSFNGNNAGTSTPSGDAGGNGFAYRIYTREYELPADAIDPIGLRAEVEGAVALDQSTLAVATPAVKLASPNGLLYVEAGSVTLDAPAAPSIVDKPITVIYDADGALAPGMRLDYQYVSSVVLTRDSDSAVLVRGTDYDVQANTGYLYGKINTANFAATVDYTGHNSRYDLIYADAVTGDLGVVKGTGRIVDPEFKNWQPVLPSGKIALFKAYVYYDMTAGAPASQLIPVYDVKDLWKQDQVEALFERKRRNRNALPNLMRRLRRGERVDIACVGDSRTHHYGGTFAFPSLAEQLIAGGKTRDNSQFYTRQLTTFTDAAIPTYTEVDPDFAELLSKDGLTVIRPALPNGSTGYTKEGWMYHFRDALAEYGGSEVNILNFGIGGTTSATGTGGINRYNGSEPALIDAVKAVNADVVCISYGMNEPGIAATYNQVRSIAEQHIANGSEVIVWACGQVNSFGDRMTQDTWTALNDRLERAANDAGAAFVPLHAIMGSGFEGGAGFSRKSMCGADLYVHQGIQEDRVIGGFGASVVV